MKTKMAGSGSSMHDADSGDGAGMRDDWHQPRKPTS